MDLYDIAREYEKTLTKEECEKNGIYYTPEVIVKYMVRKMFALGGGFDRDSKILDFASGCGVFFNEIINHIIRNEKECAGGEYGFKHIVKNNMYSIEKSHSAQKILRKYLTDHKGIEDEYLDNLLTDDALFPENTGFENISFDYIIGNPPYVGHKKINGEYSKNLRKEYGEVYLNKSDLYYCFFQRAYEIMSDNGICSMIVPRYFLEAESAKGLRKFLKEKVKILSIMDFRDSGTFGNEIKISPCIITFAKKESRYSMDTEVVIIENREDFDRCGEDTDIQSNATIYYDEMGWKIATFRQKKIIDSIRGKKTFELGEFVDNTQGIITGCDGAFIFDSSSEIPGTVDSKNVKKWIKSRNIKKFHIEKSDKMIVYTDNMDYDELNDEMKNHLKKYRVRLENRREVKKGMRKWYKLQWGRSLTNFEGIKIVYPFKSKTNRFAIDNENHLFSADVYSFKIKEDFKDRISYEYLVAVLNSDAYEEYMHSYLKKMGNAIYEYYPHHLLKTRIFFDESYDSIETLGSEILKTEDIQEKEKIKDRIDSIVNERLGI